MLSPEKRAELLLRADALRTEISDLNSERDAALTSGSQSQADAKLIAEIATLEAQREQAETQRDQALTSTEDALKFMEQAIAAQESTTALGNAGTSTPVQPEQVEDPDLSEAKVTEAEAIEAVEEPEPVAEPAAVTETASATNTKIQKGGNR